jgi:phosphoserine phosphatase RsbU/P
MRALVGWDDPAEAELISLYLNVDGAEAVVCTDTAELLEMARSVPTWDVVLLPTSVPDAESAYQLFDQVRTLLPDCPIVGACHPEDVFRVARFMTHGLRAYLIRDPAGDFMFLLQNTLAGAVEAVRAERERLIAERLREEIESVRRLQESIIPRDLDSPPGYCLTARYEPAQIRVLGGQPVVLAGGDYYDVFLLDDHSLVLLVGDASGHGMKACMSIMTMHTLVRMIRNRVYRDTASFVADINRQLCEQSVVQEDGGFITLLYGILRADTHQFQWTSAGHPVPMLHDLATNTVRPLGTIDDGGLPLGIVPEADYEMLTSPIPPGNRLLIYTDGLEEAFPDVDRRHSEFGRGGIEATLREGLNNALVESTNTKIRLLTRMAFGFASARPGKGATIGVPVAAKMSFPWWVRPPGRGTPKSSEKWCGPRTGQTNSGPSPRRPGDPECASSPPRTAS